MYQLLNPSHIYLLEPIFHVIYSLKNIINSDYNNISFFHSTGPTQKYWKVKNSNTLDHDIQRYFYDNTIEYIYNNFTIEFIKEYLPEIYININNVKIPFNYWHNQPFGIYHNLNKIQSI